MTDITVVQQSNTVSVSSSGPQGPTGPTGPTGATGATGAQGPPGDISAGGTVSGELDVTGRLAAAGFALPFLPPVTRPRYFADASSTVTLFQSGHGWTTGGGVGSSNLNDTTDYVRGSQAVSVTTDGTGTGAYVQRLGMSSVNLTGKMLRVLMKIDDITHVKFVNFFVGTSSLANNFKWIAQRVTSTTSQNWMQSGEWVSVTLQWADVNSAAGSYSLSSKAVPSITTGFTDMRLQVVGDGGGAVKFHVQAVEVLDDTSSTFPEGVVSVTFDDSYQSAYDYARPYMENLGFRGTMFTIADVIGTSTFQTMAQLKSMQNMSGWEIAGHAYTRANHDVGYDTLDAATVHKEVQLLRAWLVDNGFPSDNFSYPRGFFKTTTDGVSIEELVSKYFNTGRSINYDAVRESWPPPMPLRMRAVSSVSAQIGSGSVAYPANLVADGGLLDRCQQQGMWLQLTFHKITTGAATTTTECSQADFQTVMDGIAARGIKVLPIADVTRFYS